MERHRRSRPHLIRRIRAAGLWLVCAALAAQALWAPLALLVDLDPVETLRRGSLPSSDDFVARVETLAPALEGATVVGYRSPHPVGLRERRSRRAEGQYRLVQYALAPVVVAPHANAELVVVNMERDDAVIAFVSETGAELVQSAGEGLAVVRTAP